MICPTGEVSIFTNGTVSVLVEFALLYFKYYYSMTLIKYWFSIGNAWYQSRHNSENLDP